jgi:hypothetical protein
MVYALARQEKRRLGAVIVAREGPQITLSEIAIPGIHQMRRFRKKDAVVAH